jgi:hypothetical protein
LTFQSQLFHGAQQRSSLEQVLPLLQGAVDTTITAYNSTGIRYANAYERATDEQLTFNNALNASWAPWAWLPLTGVAGLNISTGHDVSLLPRDFAPYPTGGPANTSDTLGRYGVGQRNTTVKTLTVNTLIPGLHDRLKTAVGINISTQNTSDFSSHQDTLVLGVNTPLTLSSPASQTVTGTATYGWFFEPQVMLSERFFLKPGFRLDGGNANGGRASTAGLPNKLSFAALFPKVNFSWVAVNRQDGDAAPLFGFLTLLRPRLALGSAGVQPAPGDKLRLLGSPLSATGVNDTLVVSTLGNTQLRPERSFEVEGGADVEVWHGRASLQLTHARKMQHDAIIDVPLAPSVYGYNGHMKINIGEIRNVNTELSASIRPVETPMISWTVGGNLSRNDNVVLQLDRSSIAQVQQASTVSGGVDIVNTKIAVGYPLFGRWARPILSYADVNKDGIIESNEIRLGDTSVYLGRNDPSVTAALTTDISLFHGRLGLHANVSHDGGYSQVNGSSGQGGASFYTSLTSANDPGATLAQQAIYVAAANQLTDYGLVQTVSMWRFESLSINYAVPFAVTRHLFAHRMSVALQGSNLGLWSNYRGKDPDVNAFSNGNATADLGQLARPRTWSLSFSLGN